MLYEFGFGFPELFTFASKESIHANPNTLHRHKHLGRSREGEEGE
jgi:hypothetical protein